MEPRRQRATIAVAVLLAIAAISGQKHATLGTGKIPPGQLWFIAVVQNMAAMSEPQATLAKSAEIDKLLAANGNHKRVFDPSSAPPPAAFCVDRAQADDRDGKGRMLIMDARAKSAQKSIVDSQPITTEAAALSLIRKWGGE